MKNITLNLNRRSNFEIVTNEGERSILSLAAGTSVAQAERIADGFAANAIVRVNRVNAVLAHYFEAQGVEIIAA